jgi:hypothetical protein
VTVLESTNDLPPFLGPEAPVYPELTQVCLVDAPALPGNVYPAAVCQFVPPLSLRARERCYVHEPNGIALGPGYYDCRLVSSYLGLPLLVTHCCPVGAFASSSSSSSSGGVGA